MRRIYLRRTWVLMGWPLGEQHRRYEQRFGRPHTDDSIDKELARLYENTEGDTVPIPKDLLLAILLRKGGGGRKEGVMPKPTKLVATEQYWHRRYMDRKRELKTQRVLNPDLVASEELAAESGMTPQQIRDWRAPRKKVKKKPGGK